MAFRKCSAQVMLEYLAMAVLILAAVVYGGPFLVNSIGARFRGAEDTAQDAFSETFVQAPPEKCACNHGSNPSTWDAVGGCGEAPCGFFEMNRQRLCPGCSPDKEEKCVESRDCCAQFVKGACGTVDPTAESTFCVSREQAVAPGAPGAKGRCLDKNGAVHGCLSNEISVSTQCGEGVTKFGCIPDGSCFTPCVSTVWTPETDTVCEGETFTQTGNCGDTRDAEGTQGPVCPPVSEAACGSEIVPTNGCGSCPGTGQSGSQCPFGQECRDGGCKPLCHHRPSGVYAGASYYTATHCGHTPACPKPGNWIGDNRTGGGCGLSKWRHNKCGQLFPPDGTMCHGDPCVLGMTHDSETSVTFRLGTYDAVNNVCSFTSSSQRNVKRDETRFNDVTYACEHCVNCGKKNCDAGFVTTGKIGSVAGVASWGQ